MKNLIAFIFFLFILSSLQAQPCKQVKTGMSSSEVLKLVGKPTEIDSLGVDINANESKSIVVVWQYGKVGMSGNQRIHFTDDKVTDLIADGKKYDELMIAFKHGEFPGKELPVRIENLNKEACK